MCGRYSLTTPVESLRRLFEFPELPNLAPRYNVAPTQEAPVVRRGDDGDSHLALLRWGLIPSWAKDRTIASRLINARAETVATTNAFRAAFKSRRCLVLADGFYEWRTEGDRRQPHRIVRADGGAFAMAGLWESWRDKAGDTVLESFTIITTEANALVKTIHARMPVILDAHDHAAWLGSPAIEERRALLRPCPPEMLHAYRVGPRVNSPRNDDAACIAAAPPAEMPRLL